MFYIFLVIHNFFLSTFYFMISQIPIHVCENIEVSLINLRSTASLCLQLKLGDTPLCTLCKPTPNALPSTTFGLRLVALQYVSFNLVKSGSHLNKNHEKVNLKNISIIFNLNWLSFLVMVNLQLINLLTL